MYKVQYVTPNPDPEDSSMPARKTREALIGFNFYGAGNIGDDLMLGGFLSHPGKPTDMALRCRIPRSISSQKIRFPEILWERGNSQHPESTTPGPWIGIGDTPFQINSGPWMIDYLKEVLSQLGPSVPRLMVGIGAETESVARLSEIKWIADQMDRISTRDLVTRKFLIEVLGQPAEKIHAGADLAHLSLAEWFHSPKPLAQRAFDLGFNYFDEEVSPAREGGIVEFWRELRKDGVRKRFFCNETRPGYERSFYQRQLRPGFFGRLGAERELVLPPYAHASLGQLISHFQDYRTVISSRYHGLLAAAWAGCKVVPLARSSKISSLAADLGLTVVDNFDPAALREAFNAAKPVNASRLAALRKAAFEAVESTWREIG
jgi:hypothetical protein